MSFESDLQLAKKRVDETEVELKVVKDKLARKVEWGEGETLDELKAEKKELRALFIEQTRRLEGLETDARQQQSQGEFAS